MEDPGQSLSKYPVYYQAGAHLDISFIELMTKTFVEYTRTLNRVHILF